MIQEQILPVFQLFDTEVKHFYEKNIWKNLQMNIQSVKMI